MSSPKSEAPPTSPAAFTVSLNCLLLPGKAAWERSLGELHVCLGDLSARPTLSEMQPEVTGCEPGT